MGSLVIQGRIKFFGAAEKLARRQRDAISGRAVESLCSGKLNLRRVRHLGDDSLGRFDGIALIRLNLRQLAEHALRQVALFHVPKPIIPEYETPATLLVRCQLLRVGLRLRIRDVVNSPEHDDLTMLSL